MAKTSFKCLKTPGQRFESTKKTGRKNKYTNKIASFRNKKIVEERGTINGSWETHETEYPEDIWTKCEAKSHCKSHDGRSFEGKRLPGVRKKSKKAAPKKAASKKTPAQKTKKGMSSYCKGKVSAFNKKHGLTKPRKAKAPAKKSAKVVVPKMKDRSSGLTFEQLKSGESQIPSMADIQRAYGGTSATKKQLQKQLRERALGYKEIDLDVEDIVAPNFTPGRPGGRVMGGEQIIEGEFREIRQLPAPRSYLALPAPKKKRVN